MTPARPVTWSDEELRKAGNTADRTYWLDNWSLRWMRPFLAALGAVHPQEHAIAKREAEREAWNKCASFMASAGPIPIAHQRARDVMFPSLLPKSPPPLVLDSGTRIERTASGGYTVHPCTSGIEHTNIPLASLGRYCTTEQDFTDIATWLGSTKEAK